MPLSGPNIREAIQGRIQSSPPFSFFVLLTAEDTAAPVQGQGGPELTRGVSVLKSKRDGTSSRSRKVTHSLLVVVGVLLGIASIAVGQPPPPGQKLGLAASLQRSYNGVKQNLTEEAAKMPEADYGFKPGPAPEMRTFGMLFGHVANAQFGACSAALGQPNPNQGRNLEVELKTKAEFAKALADSFALCDKAFAALTDQNALELVKQGQGEIARAGLFANVVSHNNEMYGTGAVYLRAKGLIPPSTERAAMRQSGGSPGR